MHSEGTDTAATPSHTLPPRSSRSLTQEQPRQGCPATRQGPPSPGASTYSPRSGVAAAATVRARSRAQDGSLRAGRANSAIPQSGGWSGRRKLETMAGAGLLSAVLNVATQSPGRKLAVSRDLPDSKLPAAIRRQPAANPMDRSVIRGSIADDSPSAHHPEASTSYRSDKLEQQKRTVIRAVSNTNRGKATTPEQRRQILEMIEDLELLNPTVDPINSPLLNGLWALLYTAPVEDQAVDKYAGSEEGPFLSRLKPLAFGSVRQTRSSQVINTGNGVAENIADFTFFGVIGSLTIRGTAEKAPATSRGAVRLNVTFENFNVQLGSWRSPTISLSWIRPKGWVDTTFLDSNFRIGRGDKGSIFVAARKKSSG